MNEREARDNVRPLGNVDRIERRREREPAEPVREDWPLRVRRQRLVATLPYPDGPLAIRRLTDEERARLGPSVGESLVDFAELTIGIRQPGALSGVRLWMTGPWEPEIAREIARGLTDVAETLGFSVLDVQVGEVE